MHALRLDTHLLLWAMFEPAKLPKDARHRIDAADVYVSAASIWEIGIKAALGKLDANAQEILEAVEPAGFAMLAITGQHTATAAALPPLHRDPFDRLLAAQALTEPMNLLSNDRLLLGYGSFVMLI